MLPDRGAKFAIFKEAVKQFSEVGYVQVGMDHFALLSDELGQAAEKGALYRNFMGYTVKKSDNLIAIGASSIGKVQNAFMQNAKSVKNYVKAIKDDSFATVRGLNLSLDDLIRQEVITSLMCNFYLNISELEARFQIDFNSYFKTELKKLENEMKNSVSPFFVKDDKKIAITYIGRFFIRNICMLFDSYLKKYKKPSFSRTI
jgi:oxygen-independent coproporphyrinogen-3 oxidase